MGWICIHAHMHSHTLHNDFASPLFSLRNNNRPGIKILIFTNTWKLRNEWQSNNSKLLIRVLTGRSKVLEKIAGDEETNNYINSKADLWIGATKWFIFLNKTLHRTNLYICYYNRFFTAFMKSWLWASNLPKQPFVESCLPPGKPQRGMSSQTVAPSTAEQPQVPAEKMKLKLGRKLQYKCEYNSVCI